MEPRIHYATTSDGVRIAFSTIGIGPPLLILPLIPPSHIQLECQNDEIRSWYTRLAERHLVIRYDHRGSGLSDRELGTSSLESQLGDIDAVIQKLNIDKLDLLGMFHSGPAAIAYAAQRPDRVRRLILWCSFARFTDIADAPRVDAARILREALAMRDYELMTDLWGFLLAGGAGGEHHRWFARYLRESCSPEVLAAWMTVSRATDVTELLGAVKASTLILHRRDLRFADVGSNRNMAAQIPDARMVLLEGRTFLPYLEDSDSVVDWIEEFLADAGAGAQQAGVHGFRTILFTDIEGHTSIMGRLGDAAGREMLRDHERITREALRSHGGDEVKTQGDGFMASFASVTRAVECAIALQRAFAAYNETAVEPLHVRVGLNAGEPIAEDGDYFGAAVILASRISGQARGGEIVASNVVRELCAGKGFLFSDRGDTALRGFEDRVRLYDVSWRPTA